MSDYSDIATIQRQLSDASMRLAAMAAAVGKAKQVLGFEGDRKKSLLSKYVSSYLEQGESSAAAEHKARAHPEFGKGMAVIYAQSGDAHKVIAEHDAAETMWQTARSLLSLNKAIIDNV